MATADDKALERQQMEDGYSDEPTETPAPTPEPSPEPSPEPTPEPTAAPDPNKALIERLEKTEGALNKLAGHIGGFTRWQNEVNTFLTASKEATKKVDDSPTQAQVNQAAASPEEWEALKKEYPEWATATEKFMEARLASVKSGADPEAIKQTVKELVAGETAEVRKQITDVALEAAFPRWKQEVKTDSFREWVKAQSDEVKALGASDDVADAAEMLRLYYRSKDKPIATPAPTPAVTPAPDKDVQRRKRFEAAISPRGTGAHASGGTSTADQIAEGYYS